MITVQNATQEYVLGNGAHEQERLKMQARILEKYGAHLKGLVLFETISRMDVRRFGGHEQAAEDLGIDEQTAVDLQQVAWETVAEGDESRPEKHAGPGASDN